MDPQTQKLMMAEALRESSKDALVKRKKSKKLQKRKLSMEQVLPALWVRVFHLVSGMKLKLTLERVMAPKKVCRDTRSYGAVCGAKSKHRIRC